MRVKKKIFEEVMGKSVANLMKHINYRSKKVKETSRITIKETIG